MPAVNRRTLHYWVDPGVVTLAVLAFIGAYWILGYFRFAGLEAPGVVPLSPAVRLATSVAVPLLLTLIAVWATGIDDAAVPTGHPWFLRMLEEPWSDWNALAWEEKMRITRRRQAVTWVFAILAAACIFVPLLLIAATG